MVGSFVRTMGRGVGRTMVVAVAVAVAVVAAAVPTLGQTFSNTAFITTSGTSTSPYPSTISVSGVSAPISNIRVRLNTIDNNGNTDWGLLLVPPAGPPVMLLRGVEIPEMLGVTAEFVPSPAPLIPFTGPILAGAYAASVYGPERAAPAPAPGLPYASSLDALINTNANGTWSLYSWDRSGVGMTVIRGWSLTINDPNLLPMGTGFTYQGRLANAGTPLNGTANLRFSLWNGPVSQSVVDQVGPVLTLSNYSVVDGYVASELDFGAGVNADRSSFLEIEVESPPGSGFVRLLPRQRLTPAPRAVRATTATAANRAATAGSAGQLLATGTSALSDRELRLRGPNDGNHGMRYAGPMSSFGGVAPDGPAIFGFGGGVLGTTEIQPRATLYWNSAGRVGIGTTDPQSRLHVVGEVRADAVRFSDGSVASRSTARSTWTGSIGTINPGGRVELIISFVGTQIGDVVVASPRELSPAIAVGQVAVFTPGLARVVLVNTSNGAVNVPVLTIDLARIP